MQLLFNFSDFLIQKANNCKGELFNSETTSSSTVQVYRDRSTCTNIVVNSFPVKQYGTRKG